MKFHFFQSSKLALILLSVISCNSINQTDCCTQVDLQVYIHYKTAGGDNLINSSEEFSESNIKLYYKDGEEYEYAYSSHLDNPDYYDVIEDSTDLLLEILPSTIFFDNDISETLIELNENVIDTLLCQFDLSSNNVICKSAWLNGIELPNRFGVVMR